MVVFLFVPVILPFRSNISLPNSSRYVRGLAETSGSWAKALFTAWSAFLFPVMPRWLGSQQKITSFLTFSVILLDFSDN